MRLRLFEMLGKSFAQSHAGHSLNEPRQCLEKLGLTVIEGIQLDDVQVLEGDRVYREGMAPESSQAIVTFKESCSIVLERWMTVGLPGNGPVTLRRRSMGNSGTSG